MKRLRLLECMAMIFACALLFNGGQAAAVPESWLLPDGYEIRAYLDCGSQEKAGDPGKPQIQMLSGSLYSFPDVSGTIGDAALGEDKVEFEFSKLDPDAAYVIGFTWWDADNQNRTQSVRFGTADPTEFQTVLPPVRAAAYHGDTSTYARIMLPVVEPFAAVNTLYVTFVKESGPNVVVSELWLLEQSTASPKKRMLVVTGDDYGGHDWRTTAPALVELLREDSRIEVTVNECPAILGSPTLTHYDAVVIHFKNYADRLPLGPECLEGLEHYAASGKGLMIVHFGCGAFQEYPNFVRIAGRVWNPALRAHDPFGEFTVHMTDASHPVTCGLTDFQTKDELYTCLDGDTPITILCEAESVVDGKVYPMAFTVEGTGGRVFHSILGHDAAAFRMPGVQRLFQQAAAWTAGCKINSNDPWMSRFVENLYEAWRSGAPMPQISALRPETTLQEAYQVQRVFVMRTMGGDRIGGYKAAGVGDTGPDSPLTGIISASGIFHARDNIVIRLQEDPARHVETEIGYIFKKSVTTPLENIEQLHEAVQSIVAVIEVPGGVTANNGTVTREDLLAWNINAKALILGEEHDPTALDPDAVTITMTRNNMEVNTARGNMAAAGQWNTLLKTVNNLIRLGYHVEPGHVITNGALGKIIPAQPGRYHADFDALGSILFEVE